MGGLTILEGSGAISAGHYFVEASIGPQFLLLFECK
jgi:hypothetical protein